MLKAKIKGEKIIIRKIQINEEPKMIKRPLFYSLEAIYCSLPYGYSYRSKPKVIMINNLNSNIFKSF